MTKMERVLSEQREDSIHRGILVRPPLWLSHSWENAQGSFVRERNWSPCLSKHRLALTPQICLPTFTECLTGKLLARSATRFLNKETNLLHGLLLDSLKYVLLHPGDTPAWLVKGSTYLSPRLGLDRPKECLTTTYKLLTSVIATKMHSHVLELEILVEEQKGCLKGSLGCKNQLLIDLSILDEVRRKETCS